MPAKPATTTTAAKSAPGPTSVSLVPKGLVATPALRILVRDFRLADGQVRAIKSGVAKVTLSHRAGQIAIWKAGDDETVVVTADGYSECNRVASVSVVTPRTVVVPGVGVQPNPFNVVDETTGCFRASYLRKVAVAPGPLGNVCIVDRTLLYSLTAYLIEDLAQISKFNPAAVMLGMRNVSPADVIEDVAREQNDDLDRQIAEAKAGGRTVPDWKLRTRVPPAEVERVKRKFARGVWAFFQIEASTGLGYWVDHSADAVRKCFLNYVQGQKFGDRKADSIATRNVLRHHPLLPQMKISAAKVRDVYATLPPGAPLDEKIPLVDRAVDVDVFFHEWEADQAAIEKLVEEYDRGIRTAGVTVDADEAAEQASREDDDGQDRDEKPAETPADDDPAPAPRAPAPAQAPDQRAALFARISTGEEIAGPDLVKSALEKYPNLKTADGRKAADALELGSYAQHLNALISKRDAEGDRKVAAKGGKR